MSVAQTDIDFARALFADLGKITSRKMMGGATLYADGAIFCVLDQAGTIFLRSKGALAQQLRAEGCAPFAWTDPKTGAVKTMGYVALPDRALDDPDLACDLARASLTESG